VIEARSVENHDGVITLLGGMAAGTVNVGGTLDASASLPSPAGRGVGGEGLNGGFIETSAAHVHVADNARVTTLAPSGNSGTWLIDPVDFTIAVSGGDMTGAAVNSALAGGNFSIQSTSGASGTSGNINVNDIVTWNVNKLTLNAFNNININANLNASATASLALEYGQGAVALNNTSNIITGNGAAVNLPASTTNFTTKQGSDGTVKNYTVITSLGAAGSTTTTDLQGMSGNLGLNYALGSNIDATATSGWNAGAGFSPVGTLVAGFSGTFDGLGHTISNLTINRPFTSYVGLFGYGNAISVIRNVGLAGGSVIGDGIVGGLAGRNDGTVSNSYATGTVTGNNAVGGLVGRNLGTLSNSYAAGSVSGSSYVGGLAGHINGGSNGTVSNSYAIGSVTSSGTNVGGLVGKNDFMLVSNSYATGSVSGTARVGGLVGHNNAGTISNSYATGSVSGSSYVGGLAGRNDGTFSNSFWDSSVNPALAGIGGSGAAQTGVTGMANADMQTQVNFTSATAANGNVNPAWDFANTWVMYDGHSAPLLRSFMTELTVTANNTTKTYDGLASVATGVSYSSTPNANLLGTLSWNGAKNAGSYAASGLYSNQQGYIISYVGGALTVNQALLNVIGTTVANKVYDTTTTATLTGGTLSGVIGSDVVTLTQAGNFASKNVGTGITVTAANSLGGAAAGNYSIAQPTGLTADITKADLAVTGLTASNKTYDATTTATLGGTATVTALGGDSVTLGGTASGAFADKNVGTGKAITVTGNTISGTDAGNYNLVQQTGLTAEIAQKSVSVSGITAVNKTYDGGTVATVNTAAASLAGLVAGDTLNVSATGAFSDKNVAAGKTVTLTSNYSGADVNNYAITNQASTTTDITARALAVSATGSNKVYDGTTTAAVTLGDNRVAGDVLTLSNTSADFTDKNAAVGKTVNVGGINVTGTDAGNYTFNTSTSTTANITAKGLTVSGLTAANKTYDGGTVATVNTAAASLTGLVAGDTLNVSATGAFSDKNVAAGKTVTLTSNYSGADVNNYAITDQASTTADITARALTVSATAANKTYDGTTTAAVTLGDNRVVGDVLALSNTSADFTDKNAAVGKTVNVGGINISGADAGNYTFNTTASTTADITAKSLTVSGLTAANKTYDGGTVATVNTAAASLTGLVAGDALTVSATGAFSDKNVGNGKTVTLTSNYSGSDVNNYAITGQASTMADITARALAVSATAANKVYDGTTTAAVTLGDNRVAGDVLALSNTSANFTDKNAAVGKTVNVGGINVSGADAGNYILGNTTATTTADITARALTLTGLTARNKVYDATSLAVLDGTAAVAALGSDAVSLTGTAGGAFADKNVGTGKAVSIGGLILSGADAGNYTLAQPAGLTANITPASLVVSGISANNKVYDGSADATLAGSATVAPLGNDRVSVGGTGTGLFSDHYVGAGKAVRVDGFMLSGDDAGNYNVVQPTGLTADITALPPAIASGTPPEPVRNVTSLLTASLTSPPTGTQPGSVGQPSSRPGPAANPPSADADAQAAGSGQGDGEPSSASTANKASTGTTTMTIGDNGPTVSIVDGGVKLPDNQQPNQQDSDEI
jgi:hypothetical protein